VSTVFPILRVTEANANPSLCVPCGGRCCKRTPGNMFPADLDPELNPNTLADKLIEMLLSGRWKLDSWAGDVPWAEPGDDSVGYFIRPRVDLGERYDHYVEPSWHDVMNMGRCNFHSDDKGCELSEEQRPSDCKSLIPREGGCQQPEGWEGKLTAVKQWWPFRQLLQDIRDLDPYYD